MKKAFTSDKIFIVICVFIALFFGIGVYVTQGEDISEQENRPLADRPVASLGSFVSGELYEELSAFYSDRIPLRTQMIRAKTLCELGLGKRENNGVKFDGDRLIDRCLYSDLSTLTTNFSRLGYLDAVTVIIPRSTDVYTDGEEAKAVTDAYCDERLYGMLCDTDRVYYKTDHHLDAGGVYAVYRYLMCELGEIPCEKEQFQLVDVSNSFLGSVYSRAGLLASGADTVSAWRYEGDTQLCVECLDKGCKTSSLYYEDAIEVKDKYLYFLGGNHGVLKIYGQGEGRKQLYIIKDSFANAVIPLLARHFDLTVYDPRYSPVPPDVPTGARTVILCGLDTLATTGGFTRPIAYINKKDE